ncbi:hypothetical protein [Ktedonobacter robiniae]|uniref:Uncharacterized protein n=1 Tax=Ktedonobacter robiniae TaxID=2778365 RepID=A0ABQ3V6H9_9CHLR|nr:hypothetical protein [Ktedonobacter robiniae]GHO60574.1 hypothetical protein KSB_90490 [Ktedonobacter robiniae]
MTEESEVEDAKDSSSFLLPAYGVSPHRFFLYNAGYYQEIVINETAVSRRYIGQSEN